jgi:hypothetical protein
MTCTPGPPTRDELDAVFTGRPGALTSAVLPWVVYAAGGTSADIAHWRDRFNQLPDEPIDPAGPVGASSASATSVPTGNHGAPLEAVPVPVIPRQLPSMTPARLPAVATTATRTQAMPAPGAPRLEAPESAASAAVAVVQRARTVPLKAWAVVASVCAVIAVTAVVGVLQFDLRTRRLAMPVAVPVAVPTPVPEEPGRKAGVFLEDTAARILQTPDPAPSGAFAYTHRTTWAVETTSDDGAPGKAGTVETITDEQLWWSHTLRGVQLTTKSRPGWVDQPNSAYLPPGPPTKVGPPTADPDMLWLRLENQYPARVGPVRCLRAVTDLIDTYPLDTAQRAAVLRLLAGCDGIAYRDQDIDRHNRPGIAISADNVANHTRDTPDHRSEHRRHPRPRGHPDRHPAPRRGRTHPLRRVRPNRPSRLTPALP